MRKENNVDVENEIKIFEIMDELGVEYDVAESIYADEHPEKFFDKEFLDSVEDDKSIVFTNCDTEEMRFLKGAYITDVSFSGEDSEIINIKAMRSRKGKIVPIEFEIHNGTVYRRND